MKWYARSGKDTMSELAVIGIPVYKATLDKFEKISLHQVKKILGRYPITFIAPESLEFDYGNEYKDFKVERFPDIYFQSTASYSLLLLSQAFYQRFLQYKFLLIYQLDAFVFADRLEEFCRLDFDYIGAPVPKSCWPYLDGYVGNGGFSLRKIKSIIRVLEKKERIALSQCLENEFNQYEDQFFAFCGTRKEFAFKVPSVREAFAFSMENEIYHCFRMLNTQLPFGCHAWHKVNFDLWKPYIEAYGYQLAGLAGENWGRALLENKKRRLRKYLSKRIIRAGKIDHLQLAIGNHINIKKEYRIWGGGEDGGRCLKLLAKAQIPVECIYDSKAQENQFLLGIAVKKPCDSEIQTKQSTIIIATKTYEQEIANRLERFGLQKQRDFLLFDEIEADIVENYYAGIGGGK